MLEGCCRSEPYIRSVAHHQFKLLMPSQVVLVTGASRGIGLAVAQELLRQGHQVAAFARTKTPELKAIIESNPHNCTLIEGDLVSLDSGAGAISLAVAHFGRLDALVLNGAAPGPFSFVRDLSDKDIEDTFCANVFSVFSFVRSAIPELRKTHGRVIFLSSALAVGGPGVSVYCATKSASNALISSVAQEEREVTFLSVDPGLVETRMATQYAEGTARLFTPGKLSPEVTQAAFKSYTADAVAVNLVALALKAPKASSGRLISWNGKEAEAASKNTV
ncbi:NAD(P)-binding protein [Auriculariales sp. MPI-PUGE-AT-0066]|nr:NAD(P)-binding protein [Auriculariales sp. MPI-PUGE-AT-0066]